MKHLWAMMMVWIPSVVYASPWTLPQGDSTVAVGFEFQLAMDEYLPDGSAQPFPLSGEFQQSALNVGVRYGFTNRFEGAVELGFKSVDYRSRPVIIGLPSEQATLPEARASIYDFNRSALGAGDIWLTGRYNLLRERVLLTNETRAKFPTGYAAPQQTFSDPSSPSPDSTQDDVTLGDGQTDLENSLLFGAFIPPTRTFIRVGSGFRFRFGDPGHQFIADAKIGQFLGDHVIVFGGGRTAWTVTRGNIVGKTFVLNRPEATPEDIQPEDISQIDLRLDRNFVQVEGGLIWSLGDVEMILNYSYIPVGANIPAIHAVSVGTTMRLSGLLD